jgi:hypothetical protein
MTQTTDTATTLEPYICANHPGRETMLRCNRCEKPICIECAVLTDVGYRCRECVKQQRATYYNAKPADAAIGAIIALVMGALLGIPAYLLLGMIGFFSFIIAFVAGPAAGGLVAEVIRRALRKRRAQPLKWLAPVCYVIGVLLVGILFFAGIPGVFMRWDVLLFVGLGAATISARML